MIANHWRAWLLIMVTVAGILTAFGLPPIPQDPAYHLFADRRSILGIPNFWNVISNLPFVCVGLFGLSLCSRLPVSAPRTAYLVFCLGVLGIGLGSAYYHYAPTMQTLVWDRLPMTVAFMALFAMVVRDRVSVSLGDRLLLPLVLAGACAVGYWYGTELQGHGDLRPYAVIQFLPMLLIPLMLMLYVGRGLHTLMLWGTLACYALAKVAEYFDGAIYDVIGVESGHSIKHVFGACAVLWAMLAVIHSRRASS
ncbi:MAG: ceramidase domain-containing protein [Gallionella sp.]